MNIKNYNFLYCFDSGYDLQTYISIISLSEELKGCNINIYIIHKSPESFYKYKLSLQDIDNIKNIELFKFKRDISNYPNLKNKHVSEATYYRIFISEYLPKNLEEIIYLDSDVFCINNSNQMIDNIFNVLKDSNKIISAHTEIIKKSKDHDLFKNLEMQNKMYFNAGVMFIDYQKWIKSVDIDRLLEYIQTYKDKIIFWDQDILNKYFDGEYTELDKSMNYTMQEHLSLDTLRKNAYFIHFSGNHKPWTIEGGVEKSSKIYFDYYQKLEKNYYHFVLKNSKIKSFISLVRSIFNLKIFNTNYPFKYFLEGIKSILQ